MAGKPAGFSDVGPEFLRLDSGLSVNRKACWHDAILDPKTDGDRRGLRIDALHDPALCGPRLRPVRTACRRPIFWP